MGQIEKGNLPWCNKDGSNQVVLIYYMEESSVSFWRRSLEGKNTKEAGLIFSRTRGNLLQLHDLSSILSSDRLTDAFL